MDVRSDWNNHELRLQTGAAFGIYADNSDEDYEDFDVTLSGRLDIQRGTAARLSTSYRHLHEDRSSPDDVGGKDPTEFDVYSISSGLSHDFGRFNAAVGGSFDRLEFDNVDAAGGGVILEEERDRDEYETTLRLGYEIVPEYEAFILGSYNIVDYDELCCDGTGTGFDRDSDGYGIALGVAFDLAGLLFGEAFAGYRSQEYDDSELKDFDGFGGGGSLVWNVTQLTTITGTARGDVGETTVTDSDGDPASGVLDATASIEVDHELLRSLILGANFSASREDYEGINRTDWLYEAGLNATYYLNRHVQLIGSYEFTTRDAEDSVDDFDENVVFLGLTVRY